MSSSKLPQIQAGAEPRFYRGNKIGCLVVHGFMAYPAEVGWMGSHLAEQGYTVYVPRLTGHGIDPHHISRMRWQDWFGQVLDAYHLLRQQCEQVYAVGHSMGGLLSLLLSTQQKLDGLVVAASPLTLDNPLIPYARVINLINRFTYIDIDPRLETHIREEQAQRGEPVIGRTNYRKWSNRAVYEMHQLMAVTLEHLSDVTVPLMLLYAEQDETAPPFNADIIRQRVSSESLEYRLLRAGQHIMFQDVGREEAFMHITNFIEQQIKKGNSVP